MKRTVCDSVIVDKDDTGAFINMTWTCPECEEVNNDLFFTQKLEELRGDFEVDRHCDYCDELITIECYDPMDGNAFEF